MSLIKPMFVGAALLVAGTVAAGAQYAQPPYQGYPTTQYPFTQYYPYNAAPAAPSSWSYDPYTSGVGPCPQRGRGDEPCSDMIAPTAGQPNFWVQ